MDTITTFPVPRAAPVSRTAGDSLPGRFTDFLVGVMLLWTAIPETLFDEAYLGEVPVRFLLFYAALGSVAAASLVAGRPRLSSLLGIALVGFTYMATLGLWNANDVKYWAIDASNFGGLILGLQWAQQRGPRRAAQLIRLWARLMAVLLFVNLAGLHFGVVTPPHDSVRQYSYSLFTNATFVTCVFPFWFTTARHDLRGKRSQIEQAVALAGIAVVMLGALMSATRSMFLTWTSAVLLTIAISFNGRNAVAWALTAATACSVVYLAVFGPMNGHGHLLAERLLATEIAQSYRYTEIEMMFDTLTGAILPGKGFGSRFESCIGERGEILAFAPHIAALTLWFKGGLPTFFIFIILPATRGIHAVLWCRNNPVSCACWCGVLLYLIQASMSGGWSYHALFLFGVHLNLGLVLSNRSKRCASSPS